MIVPKTDFRIATGHGVALASLTHVEALAAFQLGMRAFAPNAQPVNLYPLRYQVLSGKEFGDGNVTLAWTFPVVPASAITYINTLHSTNISLAVTLYTRSTPEAFARYNAYSVLPVPDVDYRFAGAGRVVDFVWRFTNLEAI